MEWEKAEDPGSSKDAGREVVATEPPPGSLSCRLSGLRVILQSLHFGQYSPGVGPAPSPCMTVCQVPMRARGLVPKVPRAGLRCHHSDEGHGGGCTSL